MNKPCISVSIEISELSDGRYAVFNRSSKKTYFIGKMEYSVLISLDGAKKIEELIEDFPMLNIGDLQRLLNQFDKIGFLKGTEVKRKNTITRITMAVFNPNKYIKQNSLFVRIFSFILLYCSFPIMMFGIWLNRNNFGEYIHLINKTFSLTTIVYIVLMTIVVLFLHEVSHVVVARKYGVNVPELGIILYWFMPGAYVNLSCVAFLKSKRQKIYIFMAGILFNLLVSGLALIGCHRVGSTAQFYLLWLAIDNFFNALFNLFVSLKLDGYLILKEIIDEKNLRERSFQYLKSLLGRIIKQLGGFTNKDSHNFYNYKATNKESSINEGIYLAYGISALLYIPILILSIVLTWISYL